MGITKEVSIHVGTSVLSRDLVWCECGRGLSLHGTWKFCPNCGGLLDQKSYRDAIDKARRNGGADYYGTPEVVEQLIRYEALQDAAKALVDAMETCHLCQSVILIDEGPTHCENCSYDCEYHDAPNCTGIDALHVNVKKALL